MEKMGKIRKISNKLTVLLQHLFQIVLDIEFFRTSFFKFLFVF